MFMVPGTDAELSGQRTKYFLLCRSYTSAGFFLGPLCVRSDSVDVLVDCVAFPSA